MSKYLEGHVDHGKPDREIKTYAEIVWVRKIRALRDRLEKAKEKGFLGVVTMPFFTDFCSACEHYIKRRDASWTGGPVKLKCRLGPLDCPAFQRLARIMEGPRIEDF